MPSKTVAFELDGAELDIDVTYSYYYRAARLNGPPESCSPEEEESEVIMPDDLAEQVKRYALDVMVPMWIKKIESQAQDMELDGKVAEWNEEDRRDFEESRAADRYDDMMYEKRGY